MQSCHLFPTRSRVSVAEAEMHGELQLLSTREFQAYKKTHTTSAFASTPPPYVQLHLHVPPLHTLTQKTPLTVFGRAKQCTISGKILIQVSREREKETQWRVTTEQGREDEIMVGHPAATVLLSSFYCFTTVCFSPSSYHTYCMLHVSLPKH